MHPETLAVTTQEAIRIAIEHHQAGRLRNAEMIYHRVLEAQPDHPDALHLLGLIAHQKGNHEVALDLIEQATRLQPSNADFLNHLGEAHRALGRPSDAEVCYRGALNLKPDHALAHNNLAIALNELGRLEAAEQHYKEAIRLDCSFDLAKLNYALLQLLRGDYGRGFELFEARFKGGDDRAIGLDRAFLETLNVPRWQGEAIPRKTLLLWTEQGLGDSLMMMRYLPLLKDRGVERLLVCCHDPLVRLMQTLDGVDEVISRDEPLPVGDFHCHCPLMSLPLLFATRIPTIPKEVPYLHVPVWLRQRWAGQQTGVAPPRIGLTWAGGRFTRTDQARSICLSSFAPLLQVSNANFVSLQKGDEAMQLKGLDLKIFDWMDECEDLLDTAALVDQLDLVISVDTAVAHLAGALGKPVWLLTRLGSEWRWMLEREDSPWYPTMRIFRQTQRGNWDEVIERVTLALRERFERPAQGKSEFLPHANTGEQGTSPWRNWLSKFRR